MAVPMLPIPALWRQRQEDGKFKTNLGHLIDLVAVTTKGLRIWFSWQSAYLSHMKPYVLSPVPHACDSQNLGDGGKRFRNLRSFLATYMFRVNLCYMRPCLKK